MAEWIPPKIDYWNTPRPVGGEDFKRIEGNTQYLKEQVDGVKTRLGRNEGDTQYLKEQVNGLKTRLGRNEGDTQYLKEHVPLWYGPSNDLIIQSTPEKIVSSQDFEIMKTIRLVHPGKYKLTVEARRGSLSSSGFQRRYSEIKISGINAVVFDVPSTSWRPFTAEIDVTTNGEISIYGRGRQNYTSGGGSSDSPLDVHVRKVQIFGAPATLGAPKVLIS